MRYGQLHVINLVKLFTISMSVLSMLIIIYLYYNLVLSMSFEYIKLFTFYSNTAQI